jgi:hypothetical protein
VVPSSSPAGSSFVRAAKNENGVVSFASAPPQNGTKGTGFSFTVGGGNEWVALQTRQFTVGASSTVAFGCEALSSGDFTAAHNMFCIVVYNCI